MAPSCMPTMLALQVSPSNLERVRRIKSRMVRLTTRVETVRRGWMDGQRS